MGSWYELSDSFFCFFFLPCFSVSIVNFEHVIAVWESSDHNFCHNQTLYFLLSLNFLMLLQTSSLHETYMYTFAI